VYHVIQIKTSIIPICYFRFASTEALVYQV
jgi:hypothetical protein